MEIKLEESNWLSTYFGGERGKSSTHAVKMYLSPTPLEGENFSWAQTICLEEGALPPTS